MAYGVWRMAYCLSLLSLFTDLRNRQESTTTHNMTVTAAQILTAETIPNYLKDRLDELKVIDTVEGIKVDAIQGGNVNYAFCITLGNGNTVFLKQAPEFVAIFGPDGFPLTSERMQREMDVYSEWKTQLGEDLASKYLPNIHYFDGKCYADSLETSIDIRVPAAAVPL